MLKAYDMREGTWTNSPMQRPPTVLSHSVVALDQTSPMVVSLGFAKLLVMGQPVHEVGGWGMPDKPAAKKRFVWFADKLRSYGSRPSRHPYTRCICPIIDSLDYDSMQLSGAHPLHGLSLALSLAAN